MQHTKLYFHQEKTTLIDLIIVNSLAIRFYHSEQDLSNSDSKRAAPEAYFSSSNLNDLILETRWSSWLPEKGILGTILKRTWMTLE